MTIELRIFFYTLFFAFISSLFISMIVEELPQDEREQIVQNILDEYRVDSDDLDFTNPLDWWEFVSSGFQVTILSLIFNTFDVFSSIFGVDYISFVGLVPVWLSTFIFLLYLVSFVSLLFYLIRILWIGG